MAGDADSRLIERERVLELDVGEEHETDAGDSGRSPIFGIFEGLIDC